MLIANSTSTDIHDVATRFLDDARGALATIVAATRKRDAVRTVDAAHALADVSAQFGARCLAAAAARLAILARSSTEAREQGLLSLAQEFAEVELDVERSLDRDVPLFI